MQSSHLLAQKIVDRIVDGFVVTLALRCWLETAFCAHDLISFLIMNEAGPDSQQASALDLVFFPDQAFQIEVEPLLQKTGFNRSDELKIIALITEMSPRTRIMWDDVSTCMPFPVELIPSFISRLNIARRLDERILGSINQHLTGPDRTRCCVILRNHAIEWKDGHVRDMQRFMGSVHSDATDFLSCFTDLLMFLSEGDLPDNLHDGLRLKRQFWTDCFHHAGEIQSRMQTTNAEIMIMGGSRILSVTPEEAIRKIDLLDRILCRMD
ncbi:MAG: hypothetical protein AB7S77_10025 [Desulfatirhabdiaceae bacterium]